MTRIARMVGTIRSVRSQIEDRNRLLESSPEAAALVVRGRELVAGLTAVEEAIHNPHAEVDYDVLAGRHGGAKLYPRFGWLFSGASDHDGPPTQGMREVAAELVAALAEEESRLETLLTEGLAGLNALAAERGVPYVLAPGAR